MVESTNFDNLLYRERDATLHDLEGDDRQYVHLTPIKENREENIMSNFQTTLGDIYTDKLYGFTGRAEARAEYPYGQNRILLVTLTDEEELEHKWFDEPQLAFSGHGRTVIPPESAPLEKRTELTKQYTDVLHGFTGMAAVRCEWLYGCNRVFLQKQKKNKELVGEWFDEPQVTGINQDTSKRPAGGTNPPV